MENNSSCIHFIGFRGDEYLRAIKVFGAPDYVHRIWDGRAKSMIIEGDVAIFAKGDYNDIPQMYSFDDSQVM